MIVQMCLELGTLSFLFIIYFFCFGADNPAMAHRCWIIKHGAELDCIRQDFRFVFRWLSVADFIDQNGSIFLLRDAKLADNSVPCLTGGLCNIFVKPQKPCVRIFFKHEFLHMHVS